MDVEVAVVDVRRAGVEDDRKVGRDGNRSVGSVELVEAIFDVEGGVDKDGDSVVESVVTVNSSDLADDTSTVVSTEETTSVSEAAVSAGDVRPP